MLNNMVIVEWVDATYDEEGWRPAPEYNKLLLEPISVQTIGFLVADKKEYVTLIQTLAKDSGYMNRFTIPRGCIISIQSLKVSEEVFVSKPTNVKALKAARKKAYDKNLS